MAAFKFLFGAGSILKSSQYTVDFFQITFEHISGDVGIYNIICLRAQFINRMQLRHYVVFIVRNAIGNIITPFTYISRKAPFLRDFTTRVYIN